MPQKSNRQFLYEAVLQATPEDQRKNIIDFPTFSQKLDDDESRIAMYEQAKKMGLAVGTPEDFTAKVMEGTSFREQAKKSAKFGMQSVRGMFDNLALAGGRGVEAGMNLLGINKEDTFENRRAKLEELKEEWGGLPPTLEQELVATRYREEMQKEFEETLPYKDESLPQGAGVDYGTVTPLGVPISPRSLALGAIRSGPSSLLAGAAMIAGGPLGIGLVGIGNIEELNQSLDAVEERTGQKIAPEYRVATTVVAGAINTALDLIPNARWMKMIKANPMVWKDTPIKKIAEQVMKKVMVYAANTGIETVTEAAQELTNELVTEGIEADGIDVARLIEAGRDGLSLSGLFGAVDIAGQMRNVNYTFDGEGNLFYKGEKTGVKKDPEGRMLYFDEESGTYKRIEDMSVKQIEEVSKKIAETFEDSILNDPEFGEETRLEHAKKLLPKWLRDILPEKNIREVASWLFMREDLLTTEKARALGSEIVEQEQKIENDTYINDYSILDDVDATGQFTKVGKAVRHKKIEKFRKDISQKLREFRDIQGRVQKAEENIADADNKIRRRQIKLEEAKTSETKSRLEKEIKTLENIKESNNKILQEQQNLIEGFLSEGDPVKVGAVKLAKLFDIKRRLMVESLTEANKIENLLNAPESMVNEFKVFEESMLQGDLSKKMTEQDVRKAFEDIVKEVEPELIEDKKEFVKRVEQLTRIGKEHVQAQNWGRDQYVTNIEIGNWRVLDKDGTTIAVAETFPKAMEKLQARRGKNITKKNYIKQGYKISSEFHKGIDPTKERLDILKGEEDIFKALKLYYPKLNAHIRLNPIKALLNNYVANEIITPGEADVLHGMIKSIETSGYTLVDAAVDAIATAITGGRVKGRAMARSLANARKIQTIKKLAARLIGGAINFTDGMHKTWVKNNLGLMQDAMRFLESDAGKELIKQEEWSLGKDFITSQLEAGYIKKEAAAMKKIVHKFNPVYFHSWPEPLLRKFCYAVNYLDAKNRGMSEFGARKVARRGVRFQQGLYTAAALPKAFGSATGKTLLQFKSFVVNHIGFLGTLNGKEWARHLGFMLATTGPKGLVLFLSSLPILGAFGYNDSLLSWVEDYFGKASAGIPGMIGVDISNSMVVNIMSGQGVWSELGPWVADQQKMIEGIIGPLMQNIGQPEEQRIPVDGYDFKKWILQTVTMAKYIEEFVDKYFERTHKLEVDNEWIRHPVSREKLYRPNNLVDQLVLLAGVKPINMTITEDAKRQLAKYDMINYKVQEKYFEKLVRMLDKGIIPDQEFMDMLGKIGLAGQLESRLTEAITKRNVTPQQVIQLKVKLSNWKERMQKSNLIDRMQQAEEEFENADQ